MVASTTFAHQWQELGVAREYRSTATKVTGKAQSQNDMTPACNAMVLWCALQALPGLPSTQVVPQQWVLEASGAEGDGLWAGGTAAADRYTRRQAAANFR
jgi:hypothetical protein